MEKNHLESHQVSSPALSEVCILHICKHLSAWHVSLQTIPNISAPESMDFPAVMLYHRSFHHHHQGFPPPLTATWTTWTRTYYNPWKKKKIPSPLWRLGWSSAPAGGSRRGGMKGPKEKPYKHIYIVLDAIFLQVWPRHHYPQPLCRRVLHNIYIWSIKYDQMLRQTDAWKYKVSWFNSFLHYICRGTCFAWLFMDRTASQELPPMITWNFQLGDATQHETFNFSNLLGLLHQTTKTLHCMRKSFHAGSLYGPMFL